MRVDCMPVNSVVLLVHVHFNFAMSADKQEYIIGMS